MHFRITSKLEIDEPQFFEISVETKQCLIKTYLHTLKQSVIYSLVEIAFI